MINKKKEITNKILNYFDEGYACSQSMLLGFAEQFNLDENTAKLVSSTFGGGMGRLRKTCGAVTGAYMVLGLKYGNNNPKNMDTKLDSYRKVRELTERFEQIHGTSDCKQILKNYATSTQVKERKHHKIICRQVIGEVADILCDMILVEPQNN